MIWYRLPFSGRPIALLLMKLDRCGNGGGGGGDGSSSSSIHQFVANGSIAPVVDDVIVEIDLTRRKRFGELLHATDGNETAFHQNFGHAGFGRSLSIASAPRFSRPRWLFDDEYAINLVYVAVPAVACAVRSRNWLHRVL